MKKFHVSLLLMIIWNLLAAQKNIRTTFLAADIEKNIDEHVISFSVAKEANVRYYLIQGVNDSVQFEFISLLNSQGNSVVPICYHYTNNIKLFTVYRINQIDMNGVITDVLYVGGSSSVTSKVLGE